MGSPSGINGDCHNGPGLSYHVYHWSLNESLLAPCWRDCRSKFPDEVSLGLGPWGPCWEQRPEINFSCVEQRRLRGRQHSIIPWLILANNTLEVHSLCRHLAYPPTIEMHEQVGREDLSQKNNVLYLKACFLTDLVAMNSKPASRKPAKKC